MPERGRVPPQLRLCRGCRQFVAAGCSGCPFCGADIDALQARHEALQEEVRRAADALRAAIAEAEARRQANSKMEASPPA